MPCFLCNKVQTDPVRGPSQWRRGVVDGEQVLICPECQAREPRWQELMHRCERCGSPRCVIVMGSIVCKACGHDAPVAPRSGPG